MTLLVVCGESSGDRAAAKVIERIAGARAFGIGGSACHAAGLESCAPTERSAAMGALDVASRALRIISVMRAVRSAIRERRPRAALLVNYTEFNARLLPLLRESKVRVLWYAAPQVWAWRPKRTRVIARGLDAMAVILPFEEPLWRDHGVATRYVGHPAMETERLTRSHTRALLGIAPDVHATAILPGSRPREVRRLLPAMLAAVGRGDHARVLLTLGLDPTARAWARQSAQRAGVAVCDISVEHGASLVLAGFDVALCASGTASLEAAIADVPAVITYRLDSLAAFVAKRALRTKHIALPNVLLGRRAFPELVQEDARPDQMRHALDGLAAGRARALADCAEVRAALGDGYVPSRTVADMITPWL